MVNETLSPRGGSSAINAGSITEEPNLASQVATDSAGRDDFGAQFEVDGNQDLDDEKRRCDEGEDVLEDGYVKSTVEIFGSVDKLALQVGRVGNLRLVGRNLAAELEHDTDDKEQSVAHRERQPLLHRATRDADAPNTHQVLDQVGKEMMESDSIKVSHQ